MVCATPSYYPFLTKGKARAARPCKREAADGRHNHAAESWQGADATSMTPRCVLWTTASVCFVDCRNMLTRVLCVLFCFHCRREWCVNKVIGFWDLGRVTTQHPHRTARPTHMASVDCLRMTAVDHRTRTLQQQQQQQQQEHSLPGRSLRFSSAHISHRSRLFARIFQIPRKIFSVQKQKILFGFSHAVSNLILL